MNVHQPDYSVVPNKDYCFGGNFRPPLLIRSFRFVNFPEFSNKTNKQKNEISNMISNITFRESSECYLKVIEFQQVRSFYVLYDRYSNYYLKTFNLYE